MCVCVHTSYVMWPVPVKSCFADKLLQGTFVCTYCTYARTCVDLRVLLNMHMYVCSCRLIFISLSNIVSLPVASLSVSCHSLSDRTSTPVTLYLWRRRLPPATSQSSWIAPTFLGSASKSYVKCLSAILSISAML